MLRSLTPLDIRSPLARYSHAVEVPAGARVVFCSGQVGIMPHDALPGTIEGQTQRCFENIKAILRDAGMTLGDLVRINAFVTSRDHLPGYMSVRDRYVNDPPPASTLMIVSGFARPEFLVEIEAIAAKLA